MSLSSPFIWRPVGTTLLTVAVTEVYTVMRKGVAIRQKEHDEPPE